jgi:plastocyanin
MPRTSGTVAGSDVREPTRLATLAPAAARRAAALVAALLAAACGGDNGTTPPPPAGATQLVKSSGDQQAWYLDNPLPDPYRVVALNVDGQPVPGVAVTWAVTSGGGTVDPPQTETDAAGLATTTHTLGPATSTQSVTAIAPGVPVVEFTAMASSPPSSGDVTVGNDFFSPRDMIVQVGGTITWTWSQGAVIHNVTYTTGPSPLPERSPTQDTGTHSNTFTTVARYEYACTIHAGMEGTVAVVK